MKKFFLVLFFTLYCVVFCSAAREFIEGTDYFVEYKQNKENMAAVLHISFISFMPAAEEAESVLKDQLQLYGKILKTEMENMQKEKFEKEQSQKDKIETAKEKGIKDIKAMLEDAQDEEEKFKNIIGSVWYPVDGDPENMQKVSYSENSSAFVWLQKTHTIVAFPDYIKFLKKEKEEKKQKEREKAKFLKQLQQLEADEEQEEPQL
ncbi:MAG: hypothetical protein LBD46_01035 [Endomicrobium sp.]|jgi:hypothetical protein|nr:hypothetical protein [Endomicrobium sp.]